MPIAIKQKFECVIHHQQQFEWLIKHKQEYIAQDLKVWIKLNSGMNRLGFKVPEIIEVIKTLKSEGFTCVLAMHFANADVDHPLNEQQKQQFLQVKQACDPVLASCCNSAVIYKWPELHFDYVRPGIMLYGASPFADKTVHDLDLKPVMSFTAEVIALNHIQAGEHVGYGSTFCAQQKMDIAIVSIGYGDGYPRAYIKQNYVAINGQLCPVVGRVSMDMLAIDVTAIQVKLGSQVELWGTHRLVDDVADANGTIGYELLCRLSNRPIRKSS
jgi:alanine racemase